MSRGQESVAAKLVDAPLLRRMHAMAMRSAVTVTSLLAQCALVLA